MAVTAVSELATKAKSVTALGAPGFVEKVTEDVEHKSSPVPTDWVTELLRGGRAGVQAGVSWYFKGQCNAGWQRDNRRRLK